MSSVNICWCEWMDGWMQQLKLTLLKWKDDGGVNLKWNQFNQLSQGYMINLKQKWFGCLPLARWWVE
jgi:hypothetical protein